MAHCGWPLLAAASMLLCACVSVQVTDSTGGVRTVRGVGMLRVELPSAAPSITGAITGIGLVQAPLGWTLGYTHQRWALLGPDCRAVVWMPRDGPDPQLVRELTHAAGVCLLDAQTGQRLIVHREEE